jgi:hypothetical protein
VITTDERLQQLRAFIIGQQYTPVQLLTDIAVLVSNEIRAFDAVPNAEAPAQTLFTRIDRLYEHLYDFRRGLRAAINYLDARRNSPLSSNRAISIQVVTTLE